MHNIVTDYVTLDIKAAIVMVNDCDIDYVDVALHLIEEVIL